MNAFLTGAGFAAVTQAFGWPRVRVWSTWHARTHPTLAAAVCASRDIVRLPAYAALDEQRLREQEAVDAALADGALAAVSAFEPGEWTLVRFCLWPELRDDLPRSGRQLYRVGHVSTSSSR
jgi:hypothetical protein